MDSPLVELELGRCRALELGDADAVEALLADDLVYVHSTGLVQDKPAFMGFLRGVLRYDSVKRGPLQVRGTSEFASCTGLLQQRGVVLRDGSPFAGTSFVTQLWTRHGGAWRLSLLQATRVEDSLWPAH